MSNAGDVPIGLVSRAPLNWYTSPDDKTPTLGGGTYGQVYRYPISDGRGTLLAEVAVKLATSEENENKARDFFYGVSESLVREMTLMSGLKHPNIVSLLDAFVWTNSKGIQEMGLVLPLATDDLASLLKHEKITTMREKKLIVMQLMRAVAYLHSKDILHGDIKPQNVLKYAHPPGEDVYVLADLGIAATNQCYDITKPFISFTIWYRPIEMLLGSYYRPVGDTWALGCLTYEVLTGRPLFTGSDNLDQIYKIFKAFGTPNRTSWPEASNFTDWRDTFPNWPTPRRVIPDLDEESRRLVLSMLVMNPDKRPYPRELLRDKWFDDVRADMETGYLKVKVEGDGEETMDGEGTTRCVSLLLDRQSKVVGIPLTLEDKERLEVWMNDRYVINSPSFAPGERTIGMARQLCMELVSEEGGMPEDGLHSAMDACMYLSSIVPNETEAGETFLRDDGNGGSSGSKRKGKKSGTRTPVEIIQRVLRVHGTDLLAATSTDLLTLLLSKSGVEYGSKVRAVSEVMLRCTHFTLLHGRYSPDSIAVFCVLTACSYAKEAFKSQEVAQRVGRQALNDVLIDFCSQIRRLWLVERGGRMLLSDERAKVDARHVVEHGGVTAEEVFTGTPALRTLLGL